MLEENENNTQFGKGMGRVAFILGEPDVRDEIHNTIKGLTFLKDYEFEKIYEEQYSTPFLIIGCDFEKEESIIATMRCLKRLRKNTATKILYVTNPSFIDLEHIVFGHELGCDFLAGTADRNNALKTFIKSISLSNIDVEGLTKWERQIKTCLGKNDATGLKKIAASLVNLGKENPAILKMLVKINRFLGEGKKELSYLHRMLQINRQNLWAASQIGKIFLESYQLKKGIEILASETDFHLDRTHNVDFKNGILARLQLESITEEMLSFLNLRAVLSIRSEQVEDGINYYTIALAGCQKDMLTKAKLHYNIGLAFNKIHRFDSAIYHLEQSLSIGKPQGFIKAQSPLGQTLKKKRDHKLATLNTERRVHEKSTAVHSDNEELDMTDD